MVCCQKQIRNNVEKYANHGTGVTDQKSEGGSELIKEISCCKLRFKGDEADKREAPPPLPIKINGDYRHFLGICFFKVGGVKHNFYIILEFDNLTASTKPKTFVSELFRMGISLHLHCFPIPHIEG